MKLRISFALSVVALTLTLALSECSLGAVGDFASVDDVLRFYGVDGVHVSMVEPDVVSRSEDLEQADHAGDGEISLPRQHQFEHFAFVSEASWAKKMDAFSRSPVLVSGRRSLSATGATRPVQTR